MKEIEKPDTVRKCPRCFGKFEFNAKEDVLWKSGGRKRIGYWYVQCPFCHKEIMAWAVKYYV